MVLPIYKVMSLIIRVFSKPLVTYIKQVHLKTDSSSNPLLRKFFISMGNAYNKGETWVNRKFMKIETQFAYKPLNDQLAIEKGIQFFYEVFFYGIVIGLPLYEMLRQANQAKAKSVALQQKLKRIDQQLQQLLKRQKQGTLCQAPQSQSQSQSQSSTPQTNPEPHPTTVPLTPPLTPTPALHPSPKHSIKLLFPNNTTHIYDIYFTHSTLHPYFYSHRSNRNSGYRKVE